MKTALFDRHVALGAKIVDFAGWEMPISYAGVVAEHLAVRRGVGIFDVSHMGCISIKGVDAEPFLNFVCTNIIVGQLDLSATYTVWASQLGGSVDDTIVYKENDNEYFVVVNASNRMKDLEHLQRVGRSFKVTITARYDQDGILAIQGPFAEKVVRKVLPDDWQLKAMRFTHTPYKDHDVVLSRTGYTGSGGFEIMASVEVIPNLWDELVEAGEEFGIQPIGLGARDTLRLEAGYALYGHELDDTIAATESISAWTVKWKKAEFLGQEALLRLQNSPKKRSQHGVVLSDPGVPRAGCAVIKGGKPIGLVTSGTFSPSLETGIAIVMVTEDLAMSETVEIEVRGRRLRGNVTKLPFYTPRT